jgi:hypothetical protein
MQKNNNNFGTAGLFNEGNNNAPREQNKPEKPQNPILENKQNNKPKSTFQQFKNAAKSASISAYGSLKSTSNSTKNLAQKKVLQSYGYNNKKNYSTDLNEFKLSNNMKNNNVQSEKNSIQTIINNSKKDASVLNMFNILKDRSKDEIVMGYNKLLIFNNEINKIIKKIRTDIKKYDHLEKKNKEYHSFLQPYLEEILKKQSHNNEYYSGKFSQPLIQQAKDHNKNKEEKSIKYAKFYLYKIFNNLSEILLIKKNIEKRIKLIRELHENNKESVITKYEETVKGNVEKYDKEYKEYIELYKSQFKGIIEKPSKNQKINKLKNYYNENPSEFKKPNNKLKEIKNNSNTSSLSSEGSANTIKTANTPKVEIRKKGFGLF